MFWYWKMVSSGQLAYLSPKTLFFVMRTFKALYLFWNVWYNTGHCSFSCAAGLRNILLYLVIALHSLTNLSPSLSPTTGNPSPILYFDHVSFFRCHMQMRSCSCLSFFAYDLLSAKGSVVRYTRGDQRKTLLTFAACCSKESVYQSKLFWDSFYLIQREVCYCHSGHFQ